MTVTGLIGRRGGYLELSGTFKEGTKCITGITRLWYSFPGVRRGGCQIRSL